MEPIIKACDKCRWLWWEECDNKGYVDNEKKE